MLPIPEQSLIDLNNKSMIDRAADMAHLRTRLLLCQRDMPPAIERNGNVSGVILPAGDEPNPGQIRPIGGLSRTAA